MEQELQELRVAVAALADQLRIQNELLAAKDAQIAALTEKIAELTAKLEEKNHKKVAQPYCIIIRSKLG